MINLKKAIRKLEKQIIPESFVIKELQEAAEKAMNEMVLNSKQQESSPEVEAVIKELNRRADLEGQRLEVLGFSL